MREKIAVFVIAIAITLSLFPNTSQASSKGTLSNIVINFVGDVHGELAIKRESLPPLKEYFGKADLNIFNLETAITNAKAKEEKQYNFKSNLDFLISLKKVGLSLANIANNHSYDYGQQGFEDTLKNLDAAGLSYIGGGANSSAAYQGKIFTIKGLRIGVLGIAKVNGGVKSLATKVKAGIANGNDLAATEQAIRTLKSKSDLLIVVTHWGVEDSFCPRSSEISSANKWKEFGADIILGSHTHTLQPITLQSNKLVAYSMGNFIFYSSKPENRSTGILKIEISPKKKITYTVLPMTINNLTKIPEKSLVAPMPAAACPELTKTSPQ